MGRLGVVSVHRFEEHIAPGAGKVSGPASNKVIQRDAAVQRAILASAAGKA